jgi:hypothetical protein
MMRSLCYTCDCTPCKCGGKIVGGVCEVCGKEYNECDCQQKEEYY